jgi:anti-sigma regulatory factor (Ser/Thr protein kinase)
MERLKLIKDKGSILNCSKEIIYEQSFKIKTLEEAYQLSVRIANETSNPNENLVICELLNNAIEHGNLGISYEEKTDFIEKDIFLDEINRRLALPENEHKYAEIQLVKCKKGLLVIITDQGCGFDYKKYLTIDSSRIMESHGRGIAIANSILKIEYTENGNKVAVRFPNL